MSKATKILKQLPQKNSEEALEKLKEAFTDDKGTVDLDLMLFYVSWLKNGLSAKEAYKELHPTVGDNSAKTLGSRTLAKVDRGLLMEAYGLDAQIYFNQLKEGIQANKQISARIVKTSPTSQSNGESPATSQTDDFIEVPDHYARKPYHDKLGKLLGIESDKGPSVAVQVNYNPEQLKDEQLDAIIT